MIRDRDDRGRPRQARPRDALGRPLPYGAAGEPPIEETPLDPAATVARAREMLADGRPFAAHETFEVAWRHRPAQERELWQGLAQVCAGLTHAARGNAVGAATLMARGQDLISRYADRGGPTYGLDLDALRGAHERARERAHQPAGGSPDQDPSATTSGVG
ncbi:MAG: DUF309 domain-containing protein [Austwickia sp.]|jgi:hypothetical protein|nr:DUF309 domain-containing protein [Austwickia sp.]MBK8437270.1 DUF309 domain-containing protein [Austwickia sp.]MBK9102503.1 DUF309 domain-containing protein [Austwickia sp.]